MLTERVQVTAEDAARFYQEYREHRQFSKEIDREIQRTYRLIAAGKMVIKALESVVKAGLDDRGLPRLALFQADQPRCTVVRHRDGSLRFCANQWARTRDRRTVEFPVGTFPRMTDPSVWTQSAVAIVPLVPLPLRPKGHLLNYSILWEADWEAVPQDPMLLRRLGEGDLWLVLAAWDLSEVERAALASRV